MPSQTATAQAYTEIAIGGSDGGWTGTATNLSADDSDYVDGPSIDTTGHYTDYLVANTFGFSLPVNSTVVGIAVRYIRGIDDDLALPVAVTLVDAVITPTLDSLNLSGGTIATESTPYNIPLAQEFTKGGPSVAWGLSLDEDDINSNDFGFAFRVDCTGSGGFTGPPAFDLVEVTVYYTVSGTDPPPPPPPSPSLGVGRLDNPLRRIPEIGVTNS